ncbi:MAG: excinuclease ABC subunit UvrC [Bacillota bacterium]
MHLQEKVKSLPNKPGVYLMKNNLEEIIYVGKAVSLKNRVKSYFQAKHHDSAKTRALVKNIADIDYILTDTELEALMLECNLIKEHRPKYNINLKDDKTYPYLKITQEDYPQILVTRKVERDGAKYYGPYTSATNLRETLEMLKRLFPFRSCKQAVFSNQRPCLNAHINKCLAPCIGRISKGDYNQIIKQVVLFLEGKQEVLITQLEKQMAIFAENLDFERAAQLRDQIQGVKQVIEKQKIVLGDGDYDVLAMARGFDEACVQVFFIRGGKLIGRENFFLRGTDDIERSEVLEGFIKQYYMQQDFVPKEILVETQLSEAKVLEQWLSEKQGRRVYIKVPQKGERKELIELVGKNALEAIEKVELEKQQKKAMTEGAVIELQQELRLAKPPLRIECFDISNIQGTETVASMVVFEGGRPKKDQYRRFKIKTVEGPNDFASMHEVITRRFKRANEELASTNGKDKFSTLPDLIIIDGGKGQLSAAREAMGAQGFSHIPTFGLAKKEEWLFVENNPEPIILPRSSKALYLLQRIRDEAHRFAITYHRSLRGKKNLASILDDIPGVGEKRRNSLLKHFGSFKGIQEASVEELLKADGMNTKVAEAIYDYLHTHQDLLLRTKHKKV